MCSLCELSTINAINAVHDTLGIQSDGAYQPLDFGDATITSVSLSGSQNTDALLNTYQWSSLSISYAFPDSISDYETYAFPDQGIENYFEEFHGSDFAQFTEQQQTATRSWLDMVSDICGLTFTEYSAQQDGDAVLKFANGAQSDPDTGTAITAFAYTPNPYDYGGDAWFGVSGTNPVCGNYDFMTIGHELGHALGLLHGHDSSNPFGAMTSSYDSMEYSIMTYRSYEGDPIDGLGYSNASDAFAQSWMMYDIAALQQMYGADYTTHAGDTQYVWDPVTGQLLIDGVPQTDALGTTVFLTIWDGDGSDRYDLSNFETNVLIDLAPGASLDFDLLSDQYAADLGDGNYASGQVYNALLYQNDERSLIENASGGSGWDRIWGNQADNILWGNDGDDRMAGYDGNDTINGGQGRDTIWGGSGVDDLKGGGWKDLIYGGTENDFIYGQNGADELHGENGWDKIWGGNGKDWILGENGNDMLYGEDGDDTVNGGWGDDYIEGNQGNDFLVGGEGSDTLLGGWGDDQLNGDAGYDILSGGEGADVFIFKNFKSGETDEITDFEDGIDLIRLTGCTYDDLTITAFNQTDTCISSGTGTIIVQNVDANLFTETDFLFV